MLLGLPIDPPLTLVWANRYAQTLTFNPHHNIYFQKWLLPPDVSREKLRIGWTSGMGLQRTPGRCKTPIRPLLHLM